MIDQINAVSNPAVHMPGPRMSGLAGELMKRKMGPRMSGPRITHSGIPKVSMNMPGKTPANQWMGM